MQEHFVDKIHFSKFLLSEKPQMHQEKIIASTRSTV